MPQLPAADTCIHLWRLQVRCEQSAPDRRIDHPAGASITWREQALPGGGKHYPPAARTPFSNSLSPIRPRSPLAQRGCWYGKM